MGSAIFDELKVCISIILVGLLVITSLWFFKYDEFIHYENDVQSIVQSTNVVPGGTYAPIKSGNNDIEIEKTRDANTGQGKNTQLEKQAQNEINGLDAKYGYMFTITQHPQTNNYDVEPNEIAEYGHPLDYYIHVNVPMFGFNPTNKAFHSRGLHVVIHKDTTSNVNN